MLTKITHPTINQQKTYLTSDLSASSTSIPVENTDGFAVDDYVVLGKPGQEKSEIVLLTSVTGNETLGITVVNKFAHSARVPVSLIKFNQIEIYRATSESGSYSKIATVDIDIDEELTIYDDTDGTSSSWYKTRFINVTKSSASDYSDAVQGNGYTDDSLWSMEEEILEEFGDPNADEISRSRVRNALNSASRALTVKVSKVIKDYRRQYATGQYTSGSLEDLPARFLKLYAINLHYSSNTIADSNPAEVEDEHLGYDDGEYSQDNPVVYFRANQFGVRPNGSPYYYMWYLDYPAMMTDPTDENGHPIGARDCLISFALWKLWRSKNGEKASQYKSDYKDLTDEYIEFVSQSRQSASPLRVNASFGSELYDNQY